MAGEDKDRGVTDRLPRRGPAAPSDCDVRVTDRLPGADAARPDGERVTTRLEKPGAGPGPASIPPRQLINGRFLVEDGPLGRETGEAQVFRCRDLHSGETVAVKLYRDHIKPKEDVLASLVNLDHPGLVGLRSYGWWDNRFFEVQEFCWGGDLTAVMPLPEKSLDGFLRQIVAGLKFCHDQGVIHRDIKPQNLLFRDQDRTQVAIGDFGISSILPEGKSEQVTQTFMFFTLDYAAPEQLRLRKVGPAADFYSLGVTLIHLLSGRPPFHDLVYHEIVDAHLRGDIPRPDGLSDWRLLLLEGLLRRSPEARWGYEKVMAWLSGEPMAEEAHYDLEIPYPQLPEVRNPVRMAGRLDAFDAAAELFRGRISLWVELFDPHLAAKVVEIEEAYAERPELGVFKLKYTLDPNLPLKIMETEIFDLVGLVEAVATADRALGHELAAAWWDGFIDCWIETAFGGDRARELVEKMRKFIERRRSDAPRLGASPLLYLLDPARPFTLAPGVILEKPGDIPTLLKKDPALKDAVQFNLYSGRFELWLELCFSDAEEDRRFFKFCREELANDRLLGLQALIWRYRPTVPFKFGGELVADPRRLAALIDAGDEARLRAKRLLKSGWLRAWLIATGRLRDVAAFDQVATGDKFTEDAALEAVLHILDPDLPPPRVQVDRAAINLGVVRAGTTVDAEFFVENPGRGHLWGRVLVEGAGAELIVAPARVEGPRAKVHVTAQPPWWIKQEASRTARLVIETNGGRAEILVEFQVVPRDHEPSEGLWGRLAGLFKPKGD
ncbi:MAG: serine/threonine-protein kinase [Pseudomonadota bacterium]